MKILCIKINENKIKRNKSLCRSVEGKSEFCSTLMFTTNTKKKKYRKTKIECKALHILEFIVLSSHDDDDRLARPQTIYFAL